MKRLYYLFLDDYRNPEEVSWVPMPNKPWDIVRSYEEFTETIQRRGLPAVISFDYDLDLLEFNTPDFNKGQKYKQKNVPTGLDCAKWLVKYCMRNKLRLPNYNVHSMNPDGKKEIISYLESYKDASESAN